MKTVPPETQCFALVYILLAFSVKRLMDLLWSLFLSQKEMTRIRHLDVIEEEEWKAKHGLSWYFQVIRLANNFIKWNIDFSDDSSKQNPIWIQPNLIAIYLALRKKIAKRFSSLMYHSLWSYFLSLTVHWRSLCAETDSCKKRDHKYLIGYFHLLLFLQIPQ